MKRLLDFDPLTGTSTWFVEDESGFSIVGEQNVDGVIEHNKRLQNEVDDKKAIKKGWWKYASIPNIFIEKWSKEIGGDILARENSKELFKRLNHPDYKLLKTTHGRHATKA
jgi:hypothetical protein